MNNFVEQPHRTIEIENNGAQRASVRSLSHPPGRNSTTGSSETPMATERGPTTARGRHRHSGVDLRLGSRAKGVLERHSSRLDDRPPILNFGLLECRKCERKNQHRSQIIFLSPSTDNLPMSR